MKRLVLLLMIATLGSACVSRAPKEDALVPQGTLASPKISVLTFNVENLFDLEDDPDKNDEAFLPSSLKDDSPEIQNRCRANFVGYRQDECLNKNWSKAAYERKMARITDVLAQVNNGYGPDILILQEVENMRVLQDWRDRYLKQMGYQTISHIEGPDERGIDVAVMSRLPMAKPAELHLIDFTKNPEIDKEDIRPTRGILETHLRLPNGDTVAVFAVHFPSQGAPTPYRKTAVETLLELARKVPSGTHVIAGGDFNITSKEEMQQKYFRGLIAKELAVSHVVGCAKCPGSTYYPKDGTWSFFDVLLFSKPVAEGQATWTLDKNSIRLVNTSVYQMNRWGSPARFGDGKGTVGVSDHWPVYAELHLTPSATSTPAQTVGAQ